MARFAPIVLAIVATLSGCTPVFGVFPSPDTLYYIRNMATGLYFDASFSSSTPGTLVIANFMNFPPSGNQQWYVIPQPVRAYRYAFQASFPTVFLHAANAAGSGVTVDDKPMSTFFNITEPVSGLPGRYFISYVNGTITSPSTPVAQLKIQRPGDALFNQLWEFVPV